MAKVLFSFLGVILAFGAVEVLARYLFPQPERIQFIPDPVTGYRHQPNQRVWVMDESREYNLWFTTNRYGDPDGERSMEKPAGVFRIAVIGDSMVEAVQVPIEERFTYLLEEQLTEWVRARQGPVREVEVLNFGTSGYGTAQEWLNYRAHVRRFQPDLVLLFFLPGNDIKNNSFELEVQRSCRPEIGPFYGLDEGGELVLENKQFYVKAVARYQKIDLVGMDRTLEVLQERVRLVSIARRAYAAIRSGSVMSGKAGQLDQEACQTATTLELFDPDIQQSSEASQEAWQEAWRVTAAVLEQFARDVTQDGGRFHVVTLTGPWEIREETRDLVLSEAEQAKYDWELPHRMTAEMLSQLELNNTLLLPALKKVSQEGHATVHYLYNGHYTPSGHQVVAETLLPILQNYLSK